MKPTLAVIREILLSLLIDCIEMQCLLFSSESVCNRRKLAFTRTDWGAGGDPFVASVTNTLVCHTVTPPMGPTQSVTFWHTFQRNGRVDVSEIEAVV